jgi:hypothetical protein
MEHHSAQKQAVLTTLVQWACKVLVLAVSGSSYSTLNMSLNRMVKVTVTSDESYNKNSTQVGEQ